MHDFRFPGETDEYRSAREQLLRAELELKRRTEAVAQLRRELPLGGAVPTDYVFDDAAGGQARLSELFGEHDTLVLYNFMFGPNAATPCPMCSSFLDGLHGNTHQIMQRVALAVVARSPIERVRDYARERGWHRFRMLSSARNDFNRDYHGEDESGAQNPMLHVFVRRADGIHHTWSSELQFLDGDPGQNQRHLDTMWPLWNVLDLTPAGRGEWYPPL